MVVDSPARSTGRRLLLWLGCMLLLAGAVGIGVHAHGRFQENLRGKMCIHNLHVLATPLKLYADDHEGRFPERLSALYPEYVTDLQLFICPEIRETHLEGRGLPHPFSAHPTPEEIDSLSSYAIVPGLTAGDDPDTVLVVEKDDNHRRVKNVRLLLDGRAMWDSPGK